MKKHETSSAALTLAALTLTGSAVAQDSDWSQLDQDIQALSANLQNAGGGIDWGGRVRAFYENSGDVAPNGDDADLGGFAVYNARLYAAGDITDNVGVRVEVDFGGNGGMFSYVDSTDGDGSDPSMITETTRTGSLGTSARLLDAYVDSRFSDGTITVRAGQFRAHVMQSSLYDSGDLLFADRSVTSAMFAGRDSGIAVLGTFGEFQIAATVQNGSDGLGDELFYAVRAQFDIAGGGTGSVEGAYGATEDLQASVGAAFFSDEGSEDTDGVAVDGSVSTSRFSVGASILSLGDGPGGGVFAPGTADVNERMPLGVALVGDSTPYSIAGSVMLTDPNAQDENGDWELAARYQDLDNGDANTRVYDVGLNYYVNGQGHDLKYILNWTSVESDDSGPDGDLIRLGVNARF